MSEVSYHINRILLSLEKYDSRHIDSSVVEDAILVIKELHFNDSLSLFYYLSALTLLNAAIKLKVFPKLHYAFIKNNARVAAERIIEHHEQYPDIYVYYSVQEKCLFFQVFDVIFSYHHVEETPLIIQASQFKTIVWKGIRLRPIAQPFYLYAKQLFTV